MVLSEALFLLISVALGLASYKFKIISGEGSFKGIVSPLNNIYMDKFTDPIYTVSVGFVNTVQ